MTRWFVCSVRNSAAHWQYILPTADRDWSEIIALYNIKLVLIDFSASRQDKVEEVWRSPHHQEKIPITETEAHLGHKRKKLAKNGFDCRAKGPACGPCRPKKLRGHQLRIWPWRDLRLLVSNIDRNLRAARITLMLLYWQSNVEHFWLFVIKKFGKSRNYLFSSYFEREEGVRQSLFPSFFLLPTKLFTKFDTSFLPFRKGDFASLFE